MDEQTVTNAYSKLSKSRTDLWQAAERVVARRSELEKVRAAALLSGQIAGRNETEREAKAHQLFKAQYEELEDAEVEERRARLTYELDRIEVQRIEAVLKLLSMSVSK